MNGFRKLSTEMREEMRQDAEDAMRKAAFVAARRKSEQGGLDEYIRFLAEGMELATSKPTRRLTDDFRL